MVLQLLAVRQFAQQGPTAVFGMLVDKVGPRGFISGGILVRVIGFGSMAFADATTSLLWIHVRS